MDEEEKNANKALKKVTFEQLIARKEQKERDQFKVKEIYIESMGGILLFQRVSDSMLLNLMDETESTSMSDSVEASRKLIYHSCPMLQDVNLHKQMGIKDPLDIARMLFDINESLKIGEKLLKFCGFSGMAEKKKNEVKN